MKIGRSCALSRVCARCRITDKLSRKLRAGAETAKASMEWRKGPHLQGRK
jgi:hypothetical protein